MAQLIWEPLGHQKSMMPAQCKLDGRRLWPVMGTCPPTSTVFRAGCFVFYDLGFFSSLPALTCHVLTGCITWAGMRILPFGVHTSAPYRRWQSCECSKQFPMNFGDLMLTR